MPVLETNAVFGGIMDTETQLGGLYLRLMTVDHNAQTVFFAEWSRISKVNQVEVNS